jgi:hypothetical protein
VFWGLLAMGQRLRERQRSVVLSSNESLLTYSPSSQGSSLVPEKTAV